MKRRDFLTLSSLATLSIITGCGGGGGTNSTNVSSSKKLFIPPLLEGNDTNGVKHYNLTIQKSNHEFFDGKLTPTYAINGTYLGPTLKLNNGDDISINYTNKLDENTTMHGHGMHVPAVMDGGVHQVISPDQTWSAVYKVKQKASTNWYHPHLMGKTAEQVYKGLAGLIIVEDDEIKNLNLPNRYGEDDIPLILQDRFFNGKYIDYSPSRMEIMRGYKGDRYLANGVINAYFNAEAKETRFRILNGSNSSVYNLKFSDNRNFKLIATDNSLLESSVTLNSIKLSPAERVEIVVDFSNDFGKSVELKSGSAKFLTVNINQNAKNSTSIPNILTSLETLDITNAPIRNFELNGSMGKLMINSKSMDKNRIDEQVPLGQVEVWKVKNSMMMEHNFHIHATHFRIISRNGNSPQDYENGYKDVVYLAPGDEVLLAVKMIDYSDSNNPYMYHCHFLEHEDAGMMGQFVVV